MRAQSHGGGSEQEMSRSLEAGAAVSMGSSADLSRIQTDMSSTDSESPPPAAKGSSRLKLNILSNFAGNFWTAAAMLLCIPIYVRFLGIAAYGLVGFYISLQAVIVLLDAGMSTVFNREMARRGSDSTQTLRDLLRTLEGAYWGLSVLIAGGVAGLAPLISHDWLHGTAVSGSQIELAVILVGLAIALEFPFILYAGGLAGLERQVELNVVVVVTTTFRCFGSALVVAFVSPTIEAFFLWQAIASVVQSVSAGLVLWHYMPGRGSKSRFSLKSFRGLGRFSAGMGTITVLGALLTQLPRLELARTLDLHDLGILSLALTVASGLYALTTPVFQGVLPRFADYVAKSQWERVRGLYHQACQTVSVLVLPAAVVLIFFGKQVVSVWTSSSATGNAVYPVLALFVIGTALHALYWVPYAVQLSYGWTRLALIMNGTAVVVLLPLTALLASRWGAEGAAVGWISLNLVYVTVGVGIMHRKLLPGDNLKWYLDDVLSPLAGAFLCVIIVWRCTDYGSNWPANPALSVTCLGLVALGSMLGAFTGAPALRAHRLVRGFTMPLLHARSVERTTG